MLALYMLGAGLIVSGLLIVMTWCGGRMALQHQPQWGFIGAGMMAFLALLPLRHVVNYVLNVFQAGGWSERIYQLFFAAAIALPMLTGLGCSGLLLWATLTTRRRRRRRRMR